jgi:peptide/nickel transport system substrate-binding protein
MKAWKGGLTFLLSVGLILSGCSTQSRTNTSDGGKKEQTAKDNSASKKGGVLNIATIGEPPTLDSHWTTAFAAQEIGYHIYEGLFAPDSHFNSQPMLAKDYKYDEKEKAYIINLREGIKFHDGSDFDADDVIASINRWMKKSQYGQMLSRNLKELKKTGPLQVVIALKDSSPSIPMLLCYPNQQAAIYPKEVVDAAGDDQIKSFIGTGPYKLGERKPDQYIKLVRNENYKPREEAPDGMAGKRTAYADELMFIPTPEVSVRLDGLEAGQFDVAEQVSTDMYDRVKTSATVDPVIVKPYWWPMAVFNKKQGIFTNPKMRQAFNAALDKGPIMKAAFTKEDFYRLDPSLLNKEQPEWYSEVGKDVYNQANIEKAKQLLQEAGYKGEPIRWVTTKEYDYMYKIAMVATEQLKKAGFNIDLQVVDWATLVSRRAKPEEFDLFSTANTFTPGPSAAGFTDPSWPGWWENPEKEKLLKEVNTEMDPAKRKAAWEGIQKLFYQDVPIVKFGDYFLLEAKSKQIKNLDGTPFPYYWNVQKQ